MSSRRNWSIPYFQENYTGPYLSDGKFQESVAFGQTEPNSMLDAFSRDHDTMYALNEDESNRGFADYVYADRAFKLGGFVPRLAGLLVLGNGNRIDSGGGGVKEDKMELLNKLFDFNHPEHKQPKVVKQTDKTVIYNPYDVNTSRNRITQDYIDSVDLSKAQVGVGGVRSVFKRRIEPIGEKDYKVSDTPVGITEHPSYAGAVPLDDVNDNLNRIYNPYPKRTFLRYKMFKSKKKKKYLFC